jgi:hypothetical protein
MKGDEDCFAGCWFGWMLLWLSAVVDVLDDMDAMMR